VLNKILKKLPIINFIAIILLAAFFVFNHFFNSDKVVYVDNTKLFDGFNMTKEMKKVGEKEFNVKKTILDSLYSKLQSSNVSELEKKQLMPQFVKNKEELEQFNQNFAGVETLKIWSRINDYAKDYAEQKNFQLIISSQNKQSVIYASDKVDKTNELLSYINKKYEGI
jgi:outer membrane protein